MAENQINPSLFFQDRNASNIDIDATLQNLPRYKIIKLLDEAFKEATEDICKDFDTTKMLQLLKIIKYNKRINPSLLSLKQPVHINGPGYGFKIVVHFHHHNNEIRAIAHICYVNKEHLFGADCKPRICEEEPYWKVIRTIQKAYSNL